MRVANLAGRLTLIERDGSKSLDVAMASNGKFGSDPGAIYEQWNEFCDWASAADFAEAEHYELSDLGPPSPAPAQVFAIGLNYADHAAESSFAVPELFPPVFTKFRTTLTGPVSTVKLPPGGHSDWEIELVLVIGRRAEHVKAADAWAHVAGLTVGQDLSERISQLAGPAPQFGLAKSFPGFGPIGPWLVTLDEFEDPDDLEMVCALNGEVVQHARTSDLLFDVPALIEGLSRVTPLLPGDVVFTGTPPGVGMGRRPPMFLQPGDVLTSWIAGIGELRQGFVGHDADT